MPAWAMRIALIAVPGMMLLSRVYAQEVKPIVEKVPSFLEQQIEGRDLVLNVNWKWKKVEGQRHVYEIAISSPASWTAANLCIDGQKAKAIPPSESRFMWDFGSLPVGVHMVSLLVANEKGDIGIASRPIRIR